MQIEYIRVGKLWRVFVDEDTKSLGVVKCGEDGFWLANMSGTPVPGYRTRLDATIGLLLQWGGRGGAPSSSEIYKWVAELAEEM
jgi:hypothetical protein